MKTITDSNLKEIFTEVIKRMEWCGYDFNDHKEASEEALMSYLKGYSLCLAGSVGTGKTFFFETLKKINIFQQQMVIYSLKANDGKNTREIQEDLMRHHCADVVIDNLGTESDWNGKRPDVVATVLSTRQASYRRTFFTTNLTVQLINERYDDRVVSRLKQFKFIPMIGEDRREPKINCDDNDFMVAICNPQNWCLCAERCSLFKNGKCSRGILAPPQMRDSTPELMCGVGEKIPYAQHFVTIAR